LELSTLLQSNANVMATTLSSLSALATELAKASSGLAGDAQKEVLSQAGRMGEKISAIVERSLGDISRQADGMISQNQRPKTPPVPVSDPQIGARINEEARTEAENMSRERKDLRKQIAGIPTGNPAIATKLNYQFHLLFKNEHGAAYNYGQVRLRATFLELNKDVALNGNMPIDLSDGSYPLPETYPLTPGRKVVLGVFVRFAPMDEIGDNVTIILPPSPDVVLEFRMRTANGTVESKTINGAVDTVVKNSGLTISAQANLKAALQQISTLGIELPFKVFDIGAEASGTSNNTVGGNSETNLAGEYVNSTNSSHEDSQSNSETRTFQVTIPLFAWDVTVK
jgi:hypothetical protein